ncbi:MAG TPA: hypothetical protein VJT09_14770 [Pyrinomonadaceae bacterium]|nr:hypothetical protein [Pyrinomonadaceae bacterium]
MRKPSSKLGLILSGLYLIFVIYILVYVFTCTEMFCGVAVVIPAMPWFYLWGSLVDGSGPLQAYLGYFFLIVSVLLNAVLLYLIGKAIGGALSSRPPR